MTNHTMPVLTEGQRQSLIADCKAGIADLEGFIESYKPKFTDHYSATNLYQIKSQLQRQQIALASLEAEPGIFEWRFKSEPVSPWIALPMEKLQQAKDTFGDLVEYRFWCAAPPVPALKLPAEVSCDGFNPKEADEARSLGQCEGWNQCVAELKRLDGVIEFKRVEGE